MCAIPHIPGPARGGQPRLLGPDGGDHAASMAEGMR
ncbi:hypothetical protein H4W33_000515 [Kibdelosporangium phytohabitans]|nr:hypothetical protein [Kibdelosporangium phytohabitans]